MKKFLALLIFFVMVLTGLSASAENVDSETSSGKDAPDIPESYNMQYKVGTYVTFGSYEQDNDPLNGKEKIEWLVLDQKDGRALLLSRCCLDCRSYDPAEGPVTWETCSLRSWLNDDFLNSAFSPQEQEKILSTVVTADKNPKYSTDPGNDTTDKVFLLSVPEVYKYFRSNYTARCLGTEYCYAKGAFAASDGLCRWWLRTPGDEAISAASVNNDGSVFVRGQFAYHRSFAVRPALWLDVTA